MPFLRKYATLTVTGTTAIRIPLIKRAVVDFAVGADYTPVAGDVKILIDGTAAANVTNLPTAIASGNGAVWEFILTAAELTGKRMVITVADSATKAVEDQCFVVETFGHASAMYQADFSLPNIPANVTQLLGTAWLTPGTAGTPDVNAKLWNGLTTVALPLIPTTAGRTLDVSATGEAGIDWANVGSPTTTLALAGTTIATTQKVDIETIKTQTVTCGAAVTVRGDVGAAAAPGAANGMLIAGSNATTTLANLAIGSLSCTAITSTGNVNFDSHFNIGGTITVTGSVDILDSLSISGGTTMSGAVMASNAGNNITGIDVASISGDPTAANNAEAFFDGTGYAGGTIKLKVDLETIKTNPVVNAGTVTFPTTATLASTTNITAGTVTTATNVTTVNGLAANVITAAAIADGAIDAATFAAGAINAAAIADGAIDAASLATDAGNKIADQCRRRTQANVEASANGDALSLNSEYGAIQQAQDANYTTGVVKKTDGTTTLGTLNIATTADAEPIRGVS